MSNWNKNAGYGLLQAICMQNGIQTFGKILVVMNTSNTGNLNKIKELFDLDNDGKVRFYATIAAAVDAATTNNNDVILLEGGATSHKVTEMLTISKNRIHFIGVEGGERLTNARCLISNTGAGAATDIAMIKVTGSGVTFKNISFKNNWTVAENLYAVHLSAADYPYFKNCTFHNLGSAHLTNANCAALCIDGAEDIELVNCTLGADTVKMTASGGQVVLMTGATTRATFTDCLFRTFTSQTNYTLFNLVGNGANNFQFFRNCIFANRVNGGATLVVAVKSDATTAGDVLFHYCTASGVTDFASAAVGNTGMFINGTSPTAGTCGIAVQPTA